MKSARPASQPIGRLQRPRPCGDLALTAALGSRNRSDARLVFSSSHPPLADNQSPVTKFQVGPSDLVASLSSAPMDFLSALISTFSTSASKVLRSATALSTRRTVAPWSRRRTDSPARSPAADAHAGLMRRSSNVGTVRPHFSADLHQTAYYRCHRI